MNIAVVKSRDMSPAVREWVQKLMHKPLEEEDEVSLIVRSPGAPTAEEREEARTRLMERIVKIDAASRSTAEAEIDAAVEESQAAVRAAFVPKR